MFNEQHYELIARAIRKTKLEISDSSIQKEASQLQALLRLQEHLDWQFRNDNANYNSNKFMEACSI